jgi:hypothetical protein
MSLVPVAPFFLLNKPRKSRFDSETLSSTFVVPQHGTPKQVGVVLLGLRAEPTTKALRRGNVEMLMRLDFAVYRSGNR